MNKDKWYYEIVMGMLRGLLMAPIALVIALLITGNIHFPHVQVVCK